MGQALQLMWLAGTRLCVPECLDAHSASSPTDTQLLDPTGSEIMLVLIPRMADTTPVRGLASAFLFGNNIPCNSSAAGQA
jgi:hypothetical protein